MGGEEWGGCADWGILVAVVAGIGLAGIGRICYFVAAKMGRRPVTRLREGTKMSAALPEDGPRTVIHEVGRITIDAVVAVQAGVPAAVITNLDGLREGGGTVIGDLIGSD